MDRSKSKVTIYMRPELHKLLKLRSVQDDLTMSELAERMLERSLVQLAAGEPAICPNCRAEIVPGGSSETASKVPVGTA